MRASTILVCVGEQESFWGCSLRMHYGGGGEESKKPEVEAVV